MDGIVRDLADEDVAFDGRQVHPDMFAPSVIGDRDLHGMTLALAAAIERDKIRQRLACLLDRAVHLAVGGAEIDNLSRCGQGHERSAQKPKATEYHPPLPLKLHLDTPVSARSPAPITSSTSQLIERLPWLHQRRIPRAMNARQPCCSGSPTRSPRPKRC
ncbi:hypothetical protein BOS5A_200699 [Bosea sp. EC-HK365B]|nr:hypothetical protein BOSE21B_110649 [Bosea sp. 21B]CAD5278311.1 hypothetical protein BOSE7B_40567 [Bosea sp. 7B]VVT58665.1 hypothetical protein BOS5A_200699 [Bosea sp. EC-HK365B]